MQIVGVESWHRVLWEIFIYTIFVYTIFVYTIFVYMEHTQISRHKNGNKFHIYRQRNKNILL